MSDCIFCQILADTLPSAKRHECDLVVAFNDIAPQAPLHVLLVSREHLGSATDLRDTPEHAALLARMHEVGRTIAVAEGYGERGWRLVTNVGAEGGQGVEHLHYHLLAGRQMAWPPG